MPPPEKKTISFKKKDGSTVSFTSTGETAAKRKLARQEAKKQAATTRQAGPK